MSGAEAKGYGEDGSGFDLVVDDMVEVKARAGGRARAVSLALRQSCLRLDVG